MSATVGTNSYVTVAQATAYFADRFGYDNWSALVNKDGALVSAAQLLDNACGWYGSPSDPAQALAFPRTHGADPVPQDIKDAQCEMAYLIAEQGSASQAAEDPLTELTAGSVTMKFDASKKGNPTTNSLVDQLLAPYGYCGGSGSTKAVPIWRS